MNNNGDTEHIIAKEVRLMNGGVLHRFTNAGGDDYSAIYVGENEQASCPRSDESNMIKWWNE